LLLPEHDDARELWSFLGRYPSYTQKWMCFRCSAVVATVWAFIENRFLASESFGPDAMRDIAAVRGAPYVYASKLFVTLLA